MALKYARVCILALVLTLTACFRPAGEPIEPTPNTNPPAPTLDLSLSTTDEPIPLNLDAGDEADASGDEGEEPATTGFGALNQLGGTLPPITVIQPTRMSDATQPAFDVNSTALPGTTPTYITPGVPLGPIPRTPTPSGGALTSTPSGLVTPTAMPGAGGGACIYIVQPGDSLFRIATNEGVTLAEMRAANPSLVGEAPILQPGQELNIPNCGQPAAPEPQPQSAAPDQPVAPPDGEVYTVRAGDTLMTIARRYNTTIEAIAQHNNLSNPNRLDIGQQLVIPPAGG